MITNILKTGTIALTIVVMAISCKESSTTRQEEIEIKTMDSTSKAIEENREKLEDQTKKVEQSLEKLDREFDSTQ